jgi:hypothetical protein
MKVLLPLALALVAGCAPLYGRCTKIEFQSDTALVGKSGTWHAVEAADAPSPPRVWMQQAAGDESLFNLALYEGSSPLAADVRVKLRAVEGEHDQGGGIVWRARDERNYYLARWNPLENNVRAYKVVDGTRTQLLGRKLEAGAGWHELRVWFRRDKIEVWFDGQSLGEFQDATFAAPGSVGLWTKADARTQFDDLEILEF